MLRTFTTKPMNRPGKFPRKYMVEIIVVCAGVVLLFMVFALFSKGGPISTDVIGYADDSLNGLRFPTIVNRYFNLYLQAIFIKLSPNPLFGLQAYWAFLISVTCGLIYLGARIFTSHSQVLHGLLAVGLFLSIESITATAGMPLVDLAAMLMVLLFTALMLLSARRAHKSIVLIGLLGFVFYLTFRTKETSLPVALLFLGLGMTTEGSYNTRLLVKRLLYVLGGILVGIVFFILLNTLFLHDPLFGFRLSDIREYLQIYVSSVFGSEKSQEIDNWYTAYFSTSLLVPFILYLVSGAKAAREKESYPGTRLIWLVPLAIIVFVTIVIGNQWGFLPRFIFPALPFICLLAPQFLDLDLGAAGDRKKRIQAILVFLIGLSLIVILRLVFRIFVARLGWDIWSFLEVVLSPVLLSIMVALVFYWKQPSLEASFLIAVLIIALIASPLVKNAKTMLRDQPNYVTAKQLFYPFSAFHDQIQYTPQMRMYVSTSYWQPIGLSHLIKDRNEVSAIFNVYYGVDSSRNNFEISTGLYTMPQDLLSMNYSYALLSLKDWKAITQDQGVSAQLKDNYQVFQENMGLVVLLKLK